MKVPLSKDQVIYYAKCYLDVPCRGVPNRAADEQLESTFECVRQRGYMTLGELRHTANW